MTSPLLALFIRSLSEDAHGKATYWVRATLCGFILLVLFFLIQEDNWARAPGLALFGVIITSQTVAISLVGLTFFGSAIAEEKEEQTLGLLRMTDLSPVSILLGKSTSRLCSALLLLAAAFPFTVFSVILGGVSLGQVIAAYCTIGAYTFLLCNVALLGSVLARHTAGAATFSAVVMGALLGSGPFLHELHDYLLKYGVKSNLHSIGTILWRNTPPKRLDEIFQTAFSGPPAGWQVASNVIIGVVFFLLSWAAFGRFCDRAPDASSGIYDRVMRLLGMNNRRRPRLKTHVIGRKDFHFLHGGTPAMILRFVGYLLLPLIILATLHHRHSLHFHTVTSSLCEYLPLIFFIDAGLMAGRLFRSELNEQTLSTLAVLPTTVRQMAYQKASVLALMLMPGVLSNLGLNAFQRQSYDPSFVNQETLNYVVWSILFIHIVIWFSLFLKRGAVPVAMVATYVALLLIHIAIPFLISKLPGAFFRSAFDSYSLLSFRTIFNVSVCLMIATFLHFHSLRRLETLAAEG